MWSDGGRPVRAYRPSLYGMPDQDNEDAEIIRLANLELYAKRARAGQPVFGESDDR